MNRTHRTLLFLVLAIGIPMNLAHGQGGPLPLPPVPAENPMTPQKVVLGKMLFFEEQLSSDDTTACATCHVPTASFADPRVAPNPGPDGLPFTPDDIFTSPGVIRADADGNYVEDAVFDFRPQFTPRITPEVFASLYANETFWDGRGSSTFVDPQTGLVSISSGGALESQAVRPPMSDVEMAHEGRDWDLLCSKLEQVIPMALASELTPDIVAALAVDGTYPALFNTAFGTPDITAERVAFAIASYERTLVPNDSPWDRFVAGDLNAMTPGQVAGWNQFNGPARCNLCHTPPFFTDNQFHNLGLRPSTEDAGRQDVTGLFADRGKFKTPSLRNAGLRSRFFHNGQAGVLMNGPAPGGVDDVYIAGGGPFNDNLDPLLLPLVGNPLVDMLQVMDFVENGLTDPRVAQGLPPFDAPVLFSQRTPGGQAGTRFGVGNPDGNGIIPRLIVATPAVRASRSFKVGLLDAPTSAPQAWLAVSLGATSPTWTNGFLLNLQTPLLTTLAATTQASTGSGNTATFHLDIPSNPALEGMEIHLQGFVLDSTANGGTAASTGGVSYMIE